MTSKESAVPFDSGRIEAAWNVLPVVREKKQKKEDLEESAKAFNARE